MTAMATYSLNPAPQASVERDFPAPSTPPTPGQTRGNNAETEGKNLIKKMSCWGRPALSSSNFNGFDGSALIIHILKEPPTSQSTPRPRFSWYSHLHWWTILASVVLTCFNSGCCPFSEIPVFTLEQQSKYQHRSSAHYEEWIISYYPELENLKSR